MAGLADKWAHFEPELSTDETDEGGEDDQDDQDQEDEEGDKDGERGADGLTPSERRAWRVEQVAEAALTCVGLTVDEDLSAGPGDGLWLSAYFQLRPEERAGAIAAIAALGDVFEGFVVIAEQPQPLCIGAMEVFAFGEAAP
jgi:hypothetical protein